MTIKISGFLRVTLQKKSVRTPLVFLIGEIDVDCYSFHNLLDVHVVQNRTLVLS